MTPKQLKAAITYAKAMGTLNRAAQRNQRKPRKPKRPPVLANCPDCGKLVAVRFPIHDCKRK